MAERRRVVRAAVPLLLAGLLFRAGLVLAAPGCDGPVRADGTQIPLAERSIVISDPDLTCYPAKIHGIEGRWTFFLRGPDVLEIEGARLEVATTSYPAVRLTWPSPTGLLADFEYPRLPLAETAYLVLLGSEGQPLARRGIEITSGDPIPPARRQSALVRLQLRPRTLEYALHGFPGDRGTKDRTLEWVGGDEVFRAILRDMGISRLRKVMSRYAEDDSIQWDERYQRLMIYRDDQLRQYIMYLDENRSEAAFKEIFLGFAQVENSFINADRRRK